MATIPSAEELGLRAPTKVARGADTRGVLSKSARSMDLASVETTAAQKGLKEVGDRIANEELATAEVQFQLASMAEAEKYANDPDLDTIEERHAAGMTDQLGKASANITSAKTRALFITRGELAMGKANANMSEKTTTRKNDREKGHMANAMDLMVKGGMDLQYGDPGTAAVGIQLTLDSMVERNVISAVDAQQTMKKAQLDMAYGRLKQMSPEQQLEILNSPDAKTQKWLADVPPDVLRSLKDEALRQEANGRALGMAFEMSSMDEAEGLAKLQQDFINGDLDDEDYEKTRLRFMRVKNDQDQVQLQAIEDYLEEGIGEIAYGGATVAQLEAAPGGIEMMKKMTPAQVANLYAAEDNAMKRAAGTNLKYSDVATKTRLRDLLAKDQHVKARKYWSENSAKLNDGDWKYFNAATSPSKSAAPEWDPIRSARQLLGEYKKQNTDMTDKQESDIWDRVDENIKSYFYDPKTAGQKPPPAMVNEWIDEEFLKIHHTENWAFDEEKFLYEMDDTGELQRDEVVAQLDFIQEATSLPRPEAGQLMSQYSQDHYEFVPQVKEALEYLRETQPNLEPWQHWNRIKKMLNIDQAGNAQVDSRSPAVEDQAGLGLNIPGQ